MSVPLEPILVSACLMGDAVRHDGAHKRIGHASLLRWEREGRLVRLCPEVAGGLPVPRLPSEVAGGGDGAAVLEQRARVFNGAGLDVSEHFLRGAGAAIRLVRQYGIRMALLKDGSPSCGSGYIHDGSFSGIRVNGRGVTAEAISRLGVRVFSEHQIPEAEEWLHQLESLA